MSYQLIFIVNAVVLVVVGGISMVMPNFVLSQFKSEIHAATLYVIRFLGGTLLLGGLMLWSIWDVPPRKQKSIALLLLAGSVGGFIMGLFGMIFTDVLRANGWVLLAAFGIFALIYGYMLFLRPEPSEAKTRAPRKPRVTPTTNGG
jgi:hypothetical protein